MFEGSVAGPMGRPLARVEDDRLLRGQGRYVSDIVEADQWTVVLVRSTHAHARIVEIDTRAAEQSPGVHGVFTAANTPDLGRPMPADGQPPQSSLATDRVRYVGEPVAAVMADNRYLAEDAAELVTITYEPLTPITNIEEARRADVLLHPQLHSNEADSIEENIGLGRAALERSDIVVEATLSMGRVSAQPMEPRGIHAVYSPKSEDLTVHYATQSVFAARERIAEFLSLDKENVRVIAPDVGGGFGAKNGAYPEEFIVTWLAYHYHHPIKWAGDRFDEFLGTSHEREQEHHVKLGLRNDGTILAFVDEYYQDNGGYTSRGALPFRNTVRNLLGPYDIPNAYIHGHLMLTCKVPQAPYRGSGRPQGHYVIERILDRAADTIGMDRVDIRLKNLYRPYPGSANPRYDTGEYAETMQRLLEHIDLKALRARQREEWQRDRYLGIGIANYVEISAGFGFEGARLTLLEDGRVQLGTGAVAHGQGHQTALAQIVSETLDIPFDQVVVREGDTAMVGRGIGTFGSRTMIMAGNAATEGSRQFLEELKKLAATRLEAHVDDIVWQASHFHVKGVPSLALSLQDLAGYATEKGLAPVTHESYFQSQKPATGFGSHALMVEVDIHKAAIRLLDYVIIHDGGRIVNPLLANGQVIGGTVQGLGSALLEEMIYDDAGQPLTASFMDYLLPGSAEMPDITLLDANILSAANPEGIKGVGEAGIIPSQAVVVSAVEDALQPLSVWINHAPVTSKRLFQALANKVSAL